MKASITRTYEEGEFTQTAKQICTKPEIFSPKAKSDDPSSELSDFAVYKSHLSYSIRTEPYQFNDELQKKITRLFHEASTEIELPELIANQTINKLLSNCLTILHRKVFLRSIFQIQNGRLLLKALPYRNPRLE
jgi:hypothetical protein